MTGKSVRQRLPDSKAVHLKKQPDGRNVPIRRHGRHRDSSLLATKLARTSCLYGCLLTRKSEKIVFICLS